MYDLTINLDDDLAARLRDRAAEDGHSMEEEALLILYNALTPPPSDGWNVENKSAE